MLLPFGRHHKAPAVDADAPPSSVTAKKTNASPPRSPSSPKKKISPLLHVQIPDTDGDDGLSTAPSLSVRSVELTLDVPPASLSPAPSPMQPGRLAKQSQMRGLSVMSYRLKQLVSKEKRRFDGDGFNLDLTYVTDRLIAFGYPAENLEGIYRNHYKDVYHFFERRHADRYKIYNLCAERSYDKDKFHHRVAEFPFADHCPPPLALFVPFCRDVFAWLGEHEQNVVAIHCKAGKGRTGVMICAYLLYTRVWTTADAAMAFFGAARSLKREGVTIPSQQRFIRYFAHLCNAADDATTREIAHEERSMTPEEFHQLWEETLDGRGLSTKRSRPVQLTLPPVVRLVLTRIRVHGIYAHKRIDPRVRVECGTRRASVVYEPLSSAHSSSGDANSSSRPVTPTAALTPVATAATPTSAGRDGSFWSTVSLDLPCGRLLVWDEVRVALRHRSGSAMGHFWFHTAFVPTETYELTLLKDEIDKMYKDAKKGHKLYASDFRVTLVLEPATPEDVQASVQSDATVSSPLPTATPPMTPTDGSARGGGGRDLRQLFHSGGGGSPGRTRAISDQSQATTAPFASVVALVAEAEAAAALTPRSPSASRISTSGKVSPTGGARSVPSSPKGFGLRFFGLGRRQDASVRVSTDAAPASHADSDDSSSSSKHS